MPTLSQLLFWVPPLLLVYAAVAYLSYHRMQSLLLPREQTTPSWSVWEVLLVGLCVIFIWDLLCLVALLLAGGPGHLYPQAHLEILQNPSRHAGQLPPDVKLTEMKLLLWAQLFSLPLKLISIPLILTWGSGTSLRELGIHRDHFLRNVQLGALGWVLVSPAVLALFGLVQWGYQEWLPEGMEEHAFTQVFQSAIPMEKALIVLLAVVAAPLVEETFFRGVVQGWARQNPQYSWYVVALAGSVAVLARWSQIQMLASAQSWKVWVNALGPLIFVWMVAAFLAIRSARLSTDWMAIISTSLLWAMVHTDAWPAPVGLLFLGTFLGWLAQRTSSLVGPMVLHALFNGIACVQMFLI